VQVFAHGIGAGTRAETGAKDDTETRTQRVGVRRHGRFKEASQRAPKRIGRRTETRVAKRIRARCGDDVSRHLSVRVFARGFAAVKDDAKHAFLVRRNDPQKCARKYASKVAARFAGVFAYVFGAPERGTGAF
jgi:hypothetical protein